MMNTIPQQKIEELIELLDDIALSQIIKERENEESYPVNLDELLSDK